MSVTCWPSSVAAGTARPDALGSWSAELALGYACDGARTVPTLRRHHGPLRVQKHFHPEGPQVCQHIIVHPPGGIAGGDSLRITVDVGAGAHALLTSPGAAKWYRSALDATLDVELRVAAGGVLEWLPLETILFAGSRSVIRNRIELAGDARLLFADVLCLGRPGSNEAFAAVPGGRWRQLGELRRDGRLLWTEQTALAADDPLLQSAVGMKGATVLGTLLWAGAPLPAEVHEACRLLPLAGRSGVSQLPQLWTARCLCDSVEDAQAWLRGIWSLLRPAVLARPAVLPRIWAT